MYFFILLDSIYLELHELQIYYFTKFLTIQRSRNLIWSSFLSTGAIPGQCSGVCPDNRAVQESDRVGGPSHPQTGGGGQSFTGVESALLVT
jgi:hypothetical protein